MTTIIIINGTSPFSWLCFLSRNLHRFSETIKGFLLLVAFWNGNLLKFMLQRWVSMVAKGGVGLGRASSSTKKQDWCCDILRFDFWSFLFLFIFEFQFYFDFHLWISFDFGLWIAFNFDLRVFCFFSFFWILFGLSSIHL